MVECIRPEPGKTIADPACGTGGFFLASYDYLTNPDNYQLDKSQKAFLKHDTFHGNEIVANTRRMCLMNMFLHNIGEIDGDSDVDVDGNVAAPVDVDVDVRSSYYLATGGSSRQVASRGSHTCRDL